VTAVDVDTDNEDNRDNCCCCCSSDDDEESGSDEDSGSEQENEDEEDYYYEGDEEQPGAAVELSEQRRSPIARFFSLVKKYYKTFQRSVKALVEHKYFQQALLGAILINTLSMGIEYHNQVRRQYFIYIRLRNKEWEENKTIFDKNNNSNKKKSLKVGVYRVIRLGDCRWKYIGLLFVYDGVAA